MSIIKISFQWPRGTAYRLVHLPALDRESGVSFTIPYIRQVGKTEQRNRRPLEIDPELWLRFTKLAGEPDESLLAFAQTWGLLRTYAEEDAEEPLSFWREQIRVMKETGFGLRRAVEHQALPSTGAFITRLEVLLLTDTKGKAVLGLRPPAHEGGDRSGGLIAAMRLQAAWSIVSGHGLNTCPVCAELFLVGAGAKRNLAKFCSAKCKKSFHRKQGVAGK